MYQIYNIDALVLNQYDGNADGTVSILMWTREFGKIYAVLRGGRKISSKMIGHLQCGGFANVDMVHGIYDWHIIGAKTIQYTAPNLKNQNEFLAWQRILSFIKQFSGTSESTELFDKISRINWEIFGTGANDHNLELFAKILILQHFGYWGDGIVNKALLNNDDREYIFTILEKNKIRLENKIDSIIVGSYL